MKSIKLAFTLFGLGYLVATIVGFSTYYIDITLMWISIFTLLPVVFGYLIGRIFDELTGDLLQATWFGPRPAGMDGEIQRATNNLTLDRLMMLAMNSSADAQVRAIALDSINQLDSWLASRAGSENDNAWRAHYSFGRFRIEQMRNDPSSIEQIEPVVVPPGEPIGTTLDFY